MNNINENEQIRKSLLTIRKLIIESETEMINIGDDEKMGSNVTKNNEKITFEGINTVGFISDGVSESVKEAITPIISEFIKASGLILDSIEITVDGSRIILNSDTIKNPSMSNVKSITFDTNQNEPQLNLVSGTLSLTSDLMSLIQSITITYADPQIGRDMLITSTQSTESEL
jgi:hypothetical protein